LAPQAIQEYYRANSPGPSAMAAPQPASLNVEVVVNPTLYSGGAISTSLSRYLQDIHAQGYNPILTTASFADTGALRNHLAARRSSVGLAGAVFVGDLPVFNFEIEAHADWSYESFPCDLYYQDLDGSWSDLDGDGLTDSHAGNVSPEIWMGRIAAGNLTALHPGRTEADLLNAYFARNHQYRVGSYRVADDGLAYVDDDWVPWAGTYSAALDAAVSGTTTVVSNGATTVASDYMARLSQEHEHLLLCAHSNAVIHKFKIGSEWTGGAVYNFDLAGLDPNVLFYNLFACSNARYTTSGYMAGEYVFGTDAGLLAVGSTKTGSMLEFQDYYTPLGQGMTFGGAWLNWWGMRAVGGFSATEKDWHYGMTMIADPLLVTQAYLPIPEPGALALLGLGAVAILRRRR
jgi:hypothetical protein